jgi:hypothetical protein
MTKAEKIARQIARTNKATRRAFETNATTQPATKRPR